MGPWVHTSAGGPDHGVRPRDGLVIASDGIRSVTELPVYRIETNEKPATEPSRAVCGMEGPLESGDSPPPSAAATSSSMSQRQTISLTTLTSRWAQTRAPSHSAHHGSDAHDEVLELIAKHLAQGRDGTVPQSDATPQAADPQALSESLSEARAALRRTELQVEVCAAGLSNCHGRLCVSGSACQRWSCVAAGFL